jgi:hypothetical protein
MTFCKLRFAPIIMAEVHNVPIFFFVEDFQNEFQQSL